MGFIGAGGSQITDRFHKPDVIVFRYLSRKLRRIAHMDLFNAFSFCHDPNPLLKP
jgi:hypothetical protein